MCSALLTCLCLLCLSLSLSLSLIMFLWHCWGNRKQHQTIGDKILINMNWCQTVFLEMLTHLKIHWFVYKYRVNYKKKFCWQNFLTTDFCYKFHIFLSRCALFLWDHGSGIKQINQFSSRSSPHWHYSVLLKRNPARQNIFFPVSVRVWRANLGGLHY